MQSIKSEAKILFCVLLSTLRVKKQAISNNETDLQELTHEWAHITVNSASLVRKQSEDPPPPHKRIRKSHKM